MFKRTEVLNFKCGNLMILCLYGAINQFVKLYVFSVIVYTTVSYYFLAFKPQLLHLYENRMRCIEVNLPPILTTFDSLLYPSVD